MDLAPIDHCAVGLDVHQAQITVCVLSEGANGEVVAEVKNLADASATAARWPRGWPASGRTWW